MRRLGVLLIILIILLGGIALFTRQRSSVSSEVAASFYPLYYFASEIADNKMSITNITPAGVEPHDYDPTPQEIANLQRSKLLLLNGAGFEPWVEGIQEELSSNGVTVVNTSEGIALKEGEADDHEGEEDDEEEHEETTFDPHFWLNPRLAKNQVQRILEGFEKVDSQNSAYYRANAEGLLKRLDELDQAYINGLSTCEKRSFVTSHAAFGYLADAYNLQQVPISGLSPDEEPSSQQLAEVTRFVEENTIEYIFFETLVSPKLSETIANEVGAKTLVLDPIEGISDDEMKKGADYFSVMNNNLVNLQTALGCTQ